MITIRDTIRAYWRWFGVIADSRPRRRRGREARHLLVLSANLPPKYNAGAFRPISFLNAGVERGWRVSAIAEAPVGVADNAGLALIGRIDPRVRLYHAAAPDLRPGWRLFPRVDGDFQRVIAAYRLACEKLSGSPPGIVFVSGPTFNMFIAGWYLARRFGARLVLDYRDEWSFDPREFVELGTVDRKWELRCLRRADAVIFTTEGLRDFYLGRVPQLEPARCRVISNGWDEREFEAVAGGRPKAGRPQLLISFLGTIGRHLPARGFLDTLGVVLERRPDLRGLLKLRFTGVDQAAAEEFAEFANRYPDNLVVEGMVGRSAVVSRIMESDALLILNEPKVGRIIPIKIFESIGSGRPLLVYGDGGEVGRIVGKLHPGPIVACGDAGALERAMDRLQAAPADAWCSTARTQWAQHHRRSVLARELFGLLETM